MSDVTKLDVCEVQKRIETGRVTVVDIRPASDYFGGRISCAHNFPGRSIRTRSKSVPQPHHLIIVGDTDEEAIEVGEIALELGFETACYLQGGMDAWMEAGLPIATASEGYGATPSADRASRS